MRSSLIIPALSLAFLISGCGSSPAGRVAQRLATTTSTLPGGHIVQVPVDRSKKVTPLPTLAPGVPTPVLPTVVPRTPKPYVWPASAYTAHIHGTITNAKTNAPIAGARVSIARGQRTSVSNAVGEYSMAFPVGASVTVDVSKKGYIAQPGIGMLPTGKSERVDFSLQPRSSKAKGPPSFPVIIGKPH